MAIEDPSVEYRPLTPRMLVVGKYIHENSDIYHDNVLVEVAVSGTVKGNEVITKTDPERIHMLEQLEQMELGLKNLDLLLVIDDSHSMRTCFKTVGEVVETMLREQLRDRNNGIITHLRIAVVYFCDTKVGSSVRYEPALNEVFEPGMSDAQAQTRIDQLVEQIKDHKYRDGGDTPEQLYLAINQAIEDNQQRLYEGALAQHHRRIMVTITDASSKPIVLPDGTELSDERTIDALVGRLVPKSPRAPFEFYAIRVDPENTKADSRHEDAILLGSQMRAFCDALNQRVRQSDEPIEEVRMAHFFPENDRELLDTDQLSETLKQTFDAIIKRQKLWSEQITQLRLGKWIANASELDAGIFTRLQGLGIDIEQFSNTDAFDLYFPGRVWMYHRDEHKRGPIQLQTEYLLSFGELQEMVGALNRFANADADTLSDPKKIRAAFEDELVGLSREGATFDTFKEAFESRYGFVTKTDFMSMSYKNLTEGLVANSKDFQEFRRKVARLDDLIHGLDRDWKVVEADIAGVKGYKLDSPPKDENSRVTTPRYFIQPGSDVRYYWVPVEDLP